MSGNAGFSQPQRVWNDKCGTYGIRPIEGVYPRQYGKIIIIMLKHNYHIKNCYHVKTYMVYTLTAQN